MKQDKKIINGFEFGVNTPEEVINILLNAMDGRKTRLKLYYGDIETGKDWHEEFDTIGYVGKSTGSIKLPLLINNSRSMGGGSILTDCIVKIKNVKTGQTLYQHPKYAAPNVEIKEGYDDEVYKYETYIDGELHGRHTTLKRAQICKSKIA